MRLRSLAARYSGHILFFGEFMERDAVEATSKGVSWWCFVSGSTQVLVVRTKTIGYLLIRRNTTKHHETPLHQRTDWRVLNKYSHWIPRAWSHARVQRISLDVRWSQLRDFVRAMWQTRSATVVLNFKTLHLGTMLQILSNSKPKLEKAFLLIKQLDFDATSIQTQSKN